MAAVRDENGRFADGSQANPGGRPKSVAKVRDLAREGTEDAIAALREIMTDPKQKGAARVAAACAVLDRGWGKPMQPIDWRSDMEKLSNEELSKLLPEAVEALGLKLVAA